MMVHINTVQSPVFTLDQLGKLRLNSTFLHMLQAVGHKPNSEPSALSELPLTHAARQLLSSGVQNTLAGANIAWSKARGLTPH
jgi:hypothetical protein